MTVSITTFWAKVDKKGGPAACWYWTAGRSGSGYGSFSVDGRSVDAHRVAYELAFGPIPAGLTVDHTCHSNDPTCPGGLCPHRLCCNPGHLEAVTRGENVLRGSGITARQARQTHCHNGHPFDEANTRHDRGNRRACRACNLAAYHRRAAKARALRGHAA